MLSKNVNEYLRSGDQLAQCAMYFLELYRHEWPWVYQNIPCTKRSNYGHCIFSTINFHYTMEYPQFGCGRRTGRFRVSAPYLRIPIVHGFTTNFCSAFIILILQYCKWINKITADAIHTFFNENRLLLRKIDQLLNLSILPDGASLRGANIDAARCGVTSSLSTFWLVEMLWRCGRCSP